MKKILILILVLIIPQVTGLGVGPAESEVIFSPGESKNISILVANPSTEKVSISVEGELSQYIQAPEFVYFDEKRETFQIRIEMPEEMEPGPKISRLRVTEIKNSTEQISAGVSVIAKITTIVPYPGKYIEAGLAKRTYSGKDDKIIIQATNYGQEDVIEARAVIEGTESGVSNIPSGETEYFNVLWNERNGVYEITGSVVYDGEEADFSGTVTKGQRYVGIGNPNVTVRNNLNLLIPLTNEWNEETQVQTVTTLEEDIPSQIVTLEAYETRYIPVQISLDGIEGERTLEVTVRYEDTETIRTFQIEVNENEVVFEGTQYERRNPPYLLYVVLIALLVLTWYYWRKGRE